jgi:hypothetical protein
MAGQADIQKTGLIGSLENPAQRDFPAIFASHPVHPVNLV